ncbi:hypothetical protein SDC9_124422 [bioreactor metagenome]|uniref:Uncharacterized protein n=1 Tax=bioreactor metagenome TaxID=1076179 RepID=A0A645CKF7_9ZZZZ
MSRHCFSFKHTARIAASAARTTMTVHYRNTMGSKSTTKIMPFHNTGKSFSLTFAYNVNLLALFKKGNSNYLTNLVGLSIAHTKFFHMTMGLKTSLIILPFYELCELVGLHFFECQLYC